MKTEGTFIWDFYNNNLYLVDLLAYNNKLSVTFLTPQFLFFLSFIIPKRRLFLDPRLRCINLIIITFLKINYP